MAMNTKADKYNYFFGLNNNGQINCHHVLNKLTASELGNQLKHIYFLQLRLSINMALDSRAC